MTTTTITLRPGERRPWVTSAGSVVLRDSDGYPSYDPDTLAPVNSTIQKDVPRALDELTGAPGSWRA